ncbi:hypothetical protein AU468_00620 [Alkalispirochaeta sphaeroplastigenens]|uniref:Cyclic nucleotide-binding domain-containing protein n=1 Tax=Alkalispirochaeta sphaeroplastigenens TaxID=1187066 RepID=A0A2S4K0W7_9SPIO|nr:cyclic nucleotide-binding domain-containing protein [Alkalispirochaeta sphaeroplastigenens]POR05412.1 hypothetical protein AU468_00620 [Alkalispirochaeta sphaeroplastigenens]
MRRFPVISSDPALNDRIGRICSRFGQAFEPLFLTSAEEALEYIRYELPEFQVVHFSDPRIDGVALIQAITEDPWLHYGGVIGVYSRKDSSRVENLPRETNVVTMIRRGEFVETFFRVLYLLHKNRQILFQRDLQMDFIGIIHGNLEMDNDPYNARTYAALIANFLFNSNYIDLELRDRLHVTLFELIMNAIEHGNCGISYEEKNRYLHDHGDIIPLIREKCRDPETGRRRVGVSYTIGKDSSSFTVSDEGAGFDWRKRFEDNQVNLDLHGHGIRMARHYFSDLSYNDRGTEVSFEVRHQKEANATPGIFSEEPPLTLEEGETVFREGDDSNDLYYIVSGTLDILSKNQLVATLSPDDIFLGEMSFLLGNRRSATVVARTPSTLIRVSKNTFVSGIRRQPHYGIFLARLLAQRLSRLNRQIAITG